MRFEMRFIFSFLRKYWVFALGSLVFMGIEVAVNLAQPAIMATIVDKGIVPGDMATVIRLGLWLFGIVLIGVAGGIACSLTADIAATRVARDVREKLYRSMLGLSMSREFDFSAGSLITRLTSDVTQIQTLIHMMLRMMIRAPLLAVGGLIMAMILSPALTAIMLAAIVVLGIVIAVLIRRGVPFFSLAQKTTDELNTVIRENLDGVRVVRAFVRADFEIERFKQKNTILRDVMSKASKMLGMAFPLIFLIMNLAIVLVLYAGGYLVYTGSMEVGTIIALTNYLMQILFALMMIGFFFMTFSRTQASIKRISELMDAEKEALSFSSQPALRRNKGANLSIRNISVRYNKKEEAALTDISCDIEAGQRLGIIGSTGAGKSTLLAALIRLIDPCSGEILIDGKRHTDMDIDNLRALFAVVFQRPVLFAGTIRENLMWGLPHADESALVKALTDAQAIDFVSKMPGGLDAHIEQGGTNLSGGQKQRIAIARALIRHPAILMLDDATSALDMETEAQLLQALKNYNSTVLMVAQKVTSIMDADKILVIDKGRTAGVGTHQQLIKTCDVYKEICQTQLEGIIK
ncbi:ABC transporter ATP-binding protein [Spirochaetia bacterium 38H-sp]|uniref:ABC transporter ATP-binding protein n=1 Tax=Rarispira pelagica TaxID=3141764 RepID=A0ABU9UBQ3_9SPIR